MERKRELPKIHYFDMNGKEILPGMKIRFDSGEVETVYRIATEFGYEDLGVNASNEDYLKLHPTANREFFSLSNFTRALKTAQIVEERDDESEDNR